MAFLGLLFFGGWGPLLWFGSGQVFWDRGVAFTGQLRLLYTSGIGNWRQIIITFIILVTMFSTVITCVDAYPRSLSEAVKTIKGLENDYNTSKYYWGFLVGIVLVASIIITYFTSSLTLFVDIVTTVAFLSSPIIAYLNFKLVRQPSFPLEFRPKPWLNFLSYFGLLCFLGFALLFILSKMGIL